MMPKQDSRIQELSKEIVQEETIEKTYKAQDGTMYSSYEEYVNSPNLDTDLVQLKLMQGQRKPQNEFERALLRSIEEAKSQGKCLEIYPE